MRLRWRWNQSRLKWEVRIVGYDSELKYIVDDGWGDSFIREVLSMDASDFYSWTEAVQ